MLLLRQNRRHLPAAMTVSSLRHAVSPLFQLCACACVKRRPAFSKYLSAYCPDRASNATLLSASTETSAARNSAVAHRKLALRYGGSLHFDRRLQGTAALITRFTEIPLILQFIVVDAPVVSTASLSSYRQSDPVVT